MILLHGGTRRGHRPTIGIPLCQSSLFAPSNPDKHHSEQADQRNTKNAGPDTDPDGGGLGQAGARLGHVVAHGPDEIVDGRGGLGEVGRVVGQSQRHRWRGHLGLERAEAGGLVGDLGSKFEEPTMRQTTIVSKLTTVKIKFPV